MPFWSGPRPPMGIVGDGLRTCFTGRSEVELGGGCFLFVVGWSMAKDLARMGERRVGELL